MTKQACASAFPFINWAMPSLMALISCLLYSITMTICDANRQASVASVTSMMGGVSMIIRSNDFSSSLIKSAYCLEPRSSDGLLGTMPQGIMERFSTSVVWMISSKEAWCNRSWEIPFPRLMPNSLCSRPLRKSASISRTFLPSPANRAAIFTEIKLFPTPGISPLTPIIWWAASSMLNSRELRNVRRDSMATSSGSTTASGRVPFVPLGLPLGIFAYTLRPVSRSIK